MENLHSDAGHCRTGFVNALKTFGMGPAMLLLLCLTMPAPTDAQCTEKEEKATCEMMSGCRWENLTATCTGVPVLSCNGYNTSHFGQCEPCETLEDCSQGQWCFANGSFLVNPNATGGCGCDAFFGYGSASEKGDCYDGSLDHMERYRITATVMYFPLFLFIWYMTGRGFWTLHVLRKAKKFQLKKPTSQTLILTLIASVSITVISSGMMMNYLQLDRDWVYEKHIKTVVYNIQGLSLCMAMVSIYLCWLDIVIRTKQLAKTSSVWMKRFRTVIQSGILLYFVVVMALYAVKAPIQLTIVMNILVAIGVTFGYFYAGPKFARIITSLAAGSLVSQNSSVKSDSSSAQSKKARDMQESGKRVTRFSFRIGFSCLFYITIMAMIGFGGKNNFAKAPYDRFFIVSFLHLSTAIVPHITITYVQNASGGLFKRKAKKNAKIQAASASQSRTSSVGSVGASTTSSAQSTESISSSTRQSTGPTAISQSETQRSESGTAISQTVVDSSSG